MLSPEQFSKIFLQHWKTGHLANFYLLKTAHPQGHQQLAAWVHETMAQIIVQEEQTSMARAKDIFHQQHPDMLVLNPSEQKYLLEDFAPFFSFLGLKKFAYRHRFIIIHQGELLSPLLANKLLKSLEDTPAHTTILMLVTASAQLLATLASRGVKIDLAFSPQLQHGEQLVEEQMTKYCQQQMTLSEILHACKGDKQREEAIFTWALNFCLARQSNYQEKNSWLQAIQHWNQSIQFNNSSSERLASILSLIPLSISTPHGHH